MLLDDWFGRSGLMREERISDNFLTTFQWIYSEPQNGSRQWSSFTSWLQGPENIYWITGKPGSGKSTLMKMLSTDPQTNTLLQA